MKKKSLEPTNAISSNSKIKSTKSMNQEKANHNAVCKATNMNSGQMAIIVILSNKIRAWRNRQ